GVSTAALFLISGFLTQRGGTQQIAAYGGMQRVTPVLAGTWLVAGLATLSLPGLSGFVPEYLVLLGTFRVNIVAAAFAVLAVIIAALYILLPYQRMFTGPRNESLAALPDLGAREKWVVARWSPRCSPWASCPGRSSTCCDRWRRRPRSSSPARWTPRLRPVLTDRATRLPRSPRGARSELRPTAHRLGGPD